MPNAARTPWGSLARTAFVGVQLGMVAFLAGCAGETSGPVSLAPEQRQALRDNLIQLRARVTSDTPEALFLSLRNTHVEIRDLGGVVDGVRRTIGDVKDFEAVSEAILKAFLASDELTAFKQRLRESLISNASAPMRAEYQRLTVTLTRSPLRLSFSLRQPADEQ
jgi:hypothetical protein